MAKMVGAVFGSMSIGSCSEEAAGWHGRVGHARKRGRADQGIKSLLSGSCSVHLVMASSPRPSQRQGNKGAAGADGVRFEDIEAEPRLGELAKRLKKKDYTDRKRSSGSGSPAERRTAPLGQVLVQLRQTPRQEKNAVCGWCKNCRYPTPCWTKISSRLHNWITAASSEIPYRYGAR